MHARKITTKLMSSVESMLTTLTGGKSAKEPRPKTDLQMVKPRMSQIPTNRRDSPKR